MTWIPTERINCACGGSFTMSNKSKHFKTQWHATLFKFLQENYNLDTATLRAKCEELKTPRFKHKQINLHYTWLCLAHCD